MYHWITEIQNSFVLSNVLSHFKEQSSWTNTLTELMDLVEPSFSVQFVARIMDRGRMLRTTLNRSISQRCLSTTASFATWLSMGGTSFMFTTQNSTKPNDLSPNFNCIFLGFPFPTPKSHDDFKNFVSKDEYGSHFCTICNTFKHKSCSNVVNHIESKHFPNSFVYNCKYCGKQFNARNSLNVHASKCRNEQKNY